MCELPFHLLDLLLSPALFLLELHGRGLVHGQLGDCAHHLPGRVADPGLELIHSLCQLQRVVPTVTGVGWVYMYDGVGAVSKSVYD